MIAGYFSADERPYVRADLTLPRLGVAGAVQFLVDTGAHKTVLNPDTGTRIDCPFDALVNPIEFAGVGGGHIYYREVAIVTFYDRGRRHNFPIELGIAKPHPAANGLDSLLGRDILNRLGMEYDFPQGRLRFRAQ